MHAVSVCIRINILVGRDLLISVYALIKNCTG